jgi:hypothetical protein
LLALLAVSGFAREIRLRNAVIQTGDTPQSALAQSAQNAAPANGLFLVQFTAAITDSQRDQLRYLRVELVQSVSGNAFVARLREVDLAGLRRLSFVHWVGPMKAEYKIHQSLGGINNKKRVSFLAAPTAQPAEMALLRKNLPGIVSGPKTSAGTILHALLDGNQIQALANSPSVLWIEPAPRHKLFDEISTEILAGEAEGPRAQVHRLGYDGSGVTVAVADSGLMDGSIDTMHPDLAGRVDAFFYYGRLEDAADEHSHGTHVAGIVAGNGATGETDEEGYLYGLGVAPGAHIVAQRMFDGLGGYEPPTSFEQLTRDAVQSGAIIGSNSWGDDTQGRYDLSAMEFDALVRDADGQTPGDQPYILEFSAGNAGPGERTIGSPAVAKNVIATGASQNNRLEFFIYEDGQEAMADFSSRGPAEDGRIKPDLVAPGTWIASLQSSSATDENAWLPISELYQYQGGTSQAGPNASGAAAVFVQYYRETHGGQTPSPALVKAALINSAVDMDSEFGTAPVPNNDEGWGRIDLTELIGADATFDFLDQTETLTQGQVYEKHIFAADPDLPLRITLVYTDVPGSPLTIPALVNDLDLEVIAPDGATYAGNQFLDGESVPDPAARDALNNVENIFLHAPIAGEYIVRIRAKNIAQDARRETAATDQDFALVVSGGLPASGHAFISFDRRAYSAPATIVLKLIDFDLAGSAETVVQLSSTTESTPINVRMLASGTTGVFTGSVATATGPAVADNKLQVAHNDIITALYRDTSPAETVSSTRPADLLPPLITQVSATNRFANELVTWTTSEPADALVRYGTNGVLNQTVGSRVFKEAHAISLTNLVAGQTYQYLVVSFDDAGNGATNDNNGQRFSFTAQPASTVLLVDNYVHGANDEGEEIPVTSYTDALDATGVSYEVWHVPTEGQPALADLTPFRVVIWRINDSFYDTTSLSVSQQTLLESYLKRDGGVMIASMELLSRLGDTPFRTNVLQVAEFVTSDDIFGDCPSCDADHGMPVLEGLPGDSIGARIELTMDYSSYPVFELEPIAPDIGPDVSDTFTPTTNAVPIFIDQASGRVTGIRAPRDTKQPGRLVFLSFPLDGIPMEGASPNNRAGILRNILSYLAPGINGLGTLAFDREAYSIPDRVKLSVADSDLEGKGQTIAKIVSTTDPAGITVTLTETPRRGVFEGFVTLIRANAVPKTGELRATDGDALEAIYLDVSADSEVRVSADVDSMPVTITGVSHEANYEFAVIRWSTDEPADSLVQFGESAFLNRTAYRSALAYDHELTLNALQPDHVYFYQVVSRDAAGNTTVNDNRGKLFTFRTKSPRSVPWSDNMEGAATDWTVETVADSEFEWQRGLPQNGIETAAHSGTNVWGSNLHGSGGTYSETALISPALQLTGGNRATLRFWHSYDFSADATIEMASLQIVTNVQSAAITLAQYDGVSGSWEQAEVDLTPYIGKIVQLVWFYQLFDIEEEPNTHVGWLIDDVSIDIRTEERGTLIVQANLSQATYAIEGPSPAQGQGAAYTNSAALSGSYTVTFNPIPYYITPPVKMATLNPRSTLIIEGKYEIADTNRNNISDEWEEEYFGSVAAAHEGSIDTDDDGASDADEFAAGTSPIDPASKLAFESPMILPDGRVQLTWPAATGRIYRVLGSTDAQTWTPYTPWIRSNGSVLRHILPALSAETGRYFQLEVRP